MRFLNSIPTSGEVVWQWFAWDHGFDRSKLGHYVVRSAARCRALAPWVTKCFWWTIRKVRIRHSHSSKTGTSQQPRATSSDGRKSVVSFLPIKETGYVVNHNTGDAHEVISGLSNPHKLSRRKRGGYFISDTRRGKLIFFDERYSPKYEIALAGTRGVVVSVVPIGVFPEFDRITGRSIRQR